MNNTSVVLEKVQRAISEYNMLKVGNTVIVGLSGGADSVCLLHVLASLKGAFKLRIIASHVNHGIRGDEAKRDSDFSRALAESLNVEFRLLEADCPKEAKDNNETLEEAGRRIRYGFWRSLADENSVIATAHNSNDNAETVIFNIARGAALNGARGIPPKRDNIIRPLIFCTREEIEGYCSENKLEFVTDSTNLSNDYTRNRIRHLVLPELKNVNSAFLDAFSRFSVCADEASEYIDFVADKALENAQLSENVYSISALNGLHKAVKSRALIKAIVKFCGETPDNKKLASVLECMEKDTKLQLYKNCYCEAKNNELIFFSNGNNKYEQLSEVEEISLENFSLSFGEYLVEGKVFEEISENEKNLLDNLIDCDTIKGNLTLRTRREGDEITLLKRKVTKSLKKLFIESGVPREQRGFVPVLADSVGVVWVCGFGVNKRNSVNKNSKKIMALKGEKYGFTKYER